MTIITSVRYRGSTWADTACSRGGGCGRRLRLPLRVEMWRCRATDPRDAAAVAAADDVASRVRSPAAALAADECRGSVAESSSRGRCCETPPADLHTAMHTAARLSTSRVPQSLEIPATWSQKPCHLCRCRG